jgi:hypothetical protein
VPARRRRGASWTTVQRLARRLPGAEEGTSYGTPAFKVRKKLFARLRPEGRDLVIRMGFDDRDVLVEGDPEVFHLTDHYRDSPMVLVRLAKVREDRLDQLLEHSWRTVAGPRLVAQLEAQAR